MNGDQLDHLLLITTLGEPTPTLVAMVITWGMLLEKKKNCSYGVFIFIYILKHLSEYWNTIWGESTLHCSKNVVTKQFLQDFENCN